MRERKRSVQGALIRVVPTSNEVIRYPVITEFEYMADLLSPSTYRHNPCEHIKFTSPFNGLDYTEKNSGVKSYAESIYPMAIARQLFSSIVDEALASSSLSLEFQDNNDFEILNLIAELDDLIATFTLKFWKEISYGAVNWGILPLISDIRSLVSSYNDIFGGGVYAAVDALSKKRFHKNPINVKGYSSYYQCDYSFQGTLRMRGTFSTTLPSGNIGALALFADELGFHPDLKTVWDLIPFSFVVDYLLPVGDLLESLHPRGWFVPRFSFSGSYSVTGTLTLISKPSEPSYEPSQLTSTASCYMRTTDMTKVFTKDNTFSMSDYKFGLSLRQLFNIGYLSKDFLKELL